MKIALVIPWYGDIAGGAESACKSIAENLQRQGIEVEVLSTCVKEFLSDWSENFYKEGIYDVNGITVRRFEARKRDACLFDKINNKLMHNQKIKPKEEAQFISEMINSDNLCKYISDNKYNYDYFIFIPYMFGTSYFGYKCCPDKSILIPCVHDESYAYMAIYQEMFRSVKGLIFLSKPEQNLANKIFDTAKKTQVVTGVGIDTDIRYDPERFKEKYGIRDNFILYAGRRETGKNVNLLIEYFAKYKKNCNNELKLVLIGSGKTAIPAESNNDIVDLGFISKQDKYDAYAASAMLCQPSLNESFSIVIMESWLFERPVLVHADCEVTKDHCVESNAGLYFRNYDEFKECVNFLIDNEKISKQLGANGKRYVLENYSWQNMTRKYREFLEKI